MHISYPKPIKSCESPSHETLNRSDCEKEASIGTDRNALGVSIHRLNETMRTCFVLSTFGTHRCSQIRSFCSIHHTRIIHKSSPNFNDSRNFSSSINTPLTAVKRIGTHSGTFHCDEALACFFLKLLPDFKTAQIVRSRDPHVLQHSDVLVDVGGEYNPEKLLFDHHQRGFHQVYSPEYQTKLSSAGLIYKHYHREILTAIVPSLSSTESDLNIVADRVYKTFVESIDGIDNGVSQYPTEEKARYEIQTDVSSRIARMNPAWNESCSQEETDARFERACSLVGSEFTEIVLRCVKAWLPARSVVLNAVSDRFSVDKSGEIIRLDRYCPWKSHLFLLEPQNEIKYVLYADEMKRWRIQCVPVHEVSFESRLALPEEWRGLTHDELSDVSGIPGCMFVHPTGFIGGNVSYKGVLKMALKSLEMQGNTQ
uniref:Metal-dependent protein hydrolase n=1 Tax=Timspurckia oligopyrenoides TaxID=708627 RepID=A0A6T6PCI7_9RHOD|mmetsp:Transcript_8855/g.15951  ORF Transcript_8855/g.15951 Transcript_8855/m.15951 type:complete len:426 (+) Transcript_8855:1624-2901(+)